MDVRLNNELGVPLVILYVETPLRTLNLKRLSDGYAWAVLKTTTTHFFLPHREHV